MLTKREAPGPHTEPRPRRSGRSSAGLGGGGSAKQGRSKVAQTYRETYTLGIDAAEPSSSGKKRKEEAEPQEEEEAQNEEEKEEGREEAEPMELEEEAEIKPALSPVRQHRAAPATPRSAKQRSSRKHQPETGPKTAPASKRARPAAFVSPVAESTKKLKLNTPSSGKRNASPASGKSRRKSGGGSSSSKTKKSSTTSPSAPADHSPASSGRSVKQLAKLAVTPAASKVSVFLSPEVLQRMPFADLAANTDLVSPMAEFKSPAPLSVSSKKLTASARKESAAAESSSLAQPPKTPLAPPPASPRKSPRIAAPASQSPPLEVKANESEETRKMQQILATVLALQEYGRKYHHSFDAVPDDKEYLRRIKSKRAMSIGLIREKVRSYQYSEPAEFLADWRLLWNNTQDWLPADSTPYKVRSA